MNHSKFHDPRRRGRIATPQPRLHWNQRAYYKQEDFLPLSHIGIRSAPNHIPDHAGCQATRVLFACGHVLNEHIPCKERGMPGMSGPLINSYAPRHRHDYCMRCTTKQGNMTQVSDLLKPRQLYLQGDLADQYCEKNEPDLWRPQQHRFNVNSVGDRRKAQHEEKRTGVKDAWKVKQVLPFFTETKEKVQGEAPSKSRW